MTEYRLETQSEPFADRMVFTVPEVARLLRLSRQSAYEAVRRGEIPTIRFGKRILVPRRALLKLLEGVSGDGS